MVLLLEVLAFGSQAHPGSTGRPLLSTFQDLWMWGTQR